MRKAVFILMLGFLLYSASDAQSGVHNMGPCAECGSACLSGEYRYPGPCLRTAEPCFLDHTQHFHRYSRRKYMPGRSVFGSTLSKGEAKKLVQWLIRCDPNLKVGNVLKVKDGYEVMIVTRKRKNLIDTLFVEKDTAHIYQIYKSADE